MMMAHDKADPEVRRLIALHDYQGPGAAPSQMRAAFAAFIRRVEQLGGPKPEVMRIEDKTIQGSEGPIPVRVYESAEAMPGTMLFFHGGGWVLGDLDTADLGARVLAASLDLRVISVDYRLAPEHPFPAAFNDCLEALSYTRQQYPGPVFVAGESAGANLAAAVAHAARNDGIPLAGQILINPGLDRRASTGSHRTFGSGDGLTTEAVRRFFSWYAGGTPEHDSRVSPSLAKKLEGVAPCFIVTAGCDPLLDEALIYAQGLIAAGVSTTYLTMPSMMHGWWCLLTSSVAARKSLGEMTESLKGFTAERIRASL